MDHGVTGRRKGKSILMESRRQGRLEKQSRIGWEQTGTDSKEIKLREKRKSRMRVIMFKKRAKRMREKRKISGRKRKQC